MAYCGRERRRRFVYVTRNTEYHLLDQCCIAVRDRQTRRWIQRHVARGRRLEGSVVLLANGVAVPSLAPATVGEPMYFSLDRPREERQLVTSRVEAIDRPALEDLAQYQTRGVRSA